jgi:hypothetical protein
VSNSCLLSSGLNPPNCPTKLVVGSSARERIRNDTGTMTTSRTMMLAQSSANVPYSWSLRGTKSTSEAIFSSRLSRREIPKPTNSAAQYWAVRALTAEALLSARETHYTEMRSLTQVEDLKRNVSKIVS